MISPPPLVGNEGRSELVEEHLNRGPNLRKEDLRQVGHFPGKGQDQEDQKPPFERGQAQKEALRLLKVFQFRRRSRSWLKARINLDKLVI